MNSAASPISIGPHSGSNVLNPVCSGSGTALSGAGKKILIVDDSAIVLKTLSVKLRTHGYQVFTAKDGSEAVSTTRRERPNLILLDISFPPDVGHGGGVAWDGFLIMSWLRRMEEALSTPVIIITGSDPGAFKDRCLAAGIAGYFQKPLDYDQLLGAIGKILEGQPEDITSPRCEAAKRVLFIDDESDWRFMASIYLKDAGFEVAVASNGAEGLAKMGEMSPDLTLLDLNLANEKGLDVLRLIKAEFPATRVVLYTGMEHTPQAIQAMLGMGAHQYLRKGTMGEMLKAVQTALGQPTKSEPALKLRLAQ